MRYFKDTAGKVYGYDSTQYHLIGDKISITQTEADQLIVEKQNSDFFNLTYAEKRRAEYPSILDYIDGVVKGDQAQINDYIAKCIAVKAKYPKA
jgi:hypothetical protein